MAVITRSKAKPHSVGPDTISEDMWFFILGMIVSSGHPHVCLVSKDWRRRFVDATPEYWGGLPLLNIPHHGNRNGYTRCSVGKVRDYCEDIVVSSKELRDMRRNPGTWSIDWPRSPKDSLNVIVVQGHVRGRGVEPRWFATLTDRPSDDPESVSPRGEDTVYCPIPNRAVDKLLYMMAEHPNLRHSCLLTMLQTDCFEPFDDEVTFKRAC